MIWYIQTFDGDNNIKQSGQESRFIIGNLLLSSTNKNNLFLIYIHLYLKVYKYI